jgi:hypothetical protein
MVSHNTVVVGIDADIGVLGMDSRCPAGHPKRLDLLILEDIVQMHVFAEDVFHSAAIVCLASVRVRVIMRESCVL